MTKNLDVNVFSAGVQTHGVNPMAIEIMKDEGIDISIHTSKLLEEYSHINFDYVITVCDNAYENCQVFAAKAIKIHKIFSDPAKVHGSSDEVKLKFIEVRNLIKDFCSAFVDEYFKV